MGREHCLFLALDASNVPGKQRASFVHLAVKRAAPFADPAYDVAWTGGHAAVWFWSMARANAVLGDISSRRVRFLAEPRFVGSAHSERIEVLAVSNGAEARVWKDGCLVANRWWPNVPEASDWGRFIRGAGVASSSPCPAPLDAPISDRPWNRQTPTGFTGILDTYSVREWLALPVIAMCAVTGALAGASMRNSLELHALRAEVATLTLSAGEILDARARAEAAKLTIDQLLALRPPASPQQLAASLVAALQGQSWSLRSLAIDESGLFAATLELSSVDPAGLVSALEASGTFAEPTVEIIPNSSQVILRARAKEAAKSRGTDDSVEAP